jgi:peptide/nickel transport system permease protein
MAGTQVKSKAAAPMGVVTESGAIGRAFRRLVKDKVAFGATLVLVLLYLAVFLADVIAPYSKEWYQRELANAPPTPIYMIDDETGGLSWPYVYRQEKQFNPETFVYSFSPVTEKKYYLKFFAPGEPYKLLGFIPGDIHLATVDAPGRLSLLGNDINGRDNFSRLLFGGRISLTIGFLSLFIVFPIGLLYGGISGYFGGRVDNLMMRLAEVIMSIPTLYLLISLAAMLPPDRSSTERFAMVTLILAFVGWAGLSRTIRGMVLSIKNMEYIEAARAVGMSSVPIIIRHILPQTASFVIVAITIGVPSYILAESGLSFLGLGIQQPDASWGNMLREAQEITNILNRPWMLMPGLLIFIAVLAFNVIGDAIRDVLDPKSALRS